MKIKSKLWSRLFVTFAALLFSASGVQAQSDPVSVLNSAEFYSGSNVAVHTNSVEVISDPNGKLVVTIGSETAATIDSVTYGGVALAEAANTGTSRLAAVYYLDDPVAGTDDLVVTYSAAAKSRIGAASLGNAADGVSVTADAVAATTDSLSVDLTTIAVDTLVIAAFSQNNQGNGTTVQPYPTDQRISHGDSGSSFSSSGYVQVPTISGPTAYTWTIASAESCDAVLAGFASAGEIITDPISVLNSAEYHGSTAAATHTLSFETISDDNGKLVVTIGSETAATISSVTYGGVALTEAANTGSSRLAAVYYLDDPVAGTADIVVTFSAAAKTRIGAASLGNAADGVSVTADAVGADTDSLSVDLTTVAKDTLVIAAYTQNGSGLTTEPYSAAERISYGDSGSSFTSTGYVQVPAISGPTAYAWTISSVQNCDAVLVGFASAGEIITDPISVLNSAEFFGSPVATTHTHSFEVVSDPNGKLVVTVGAEGDLDIASVTYGGLPLTAAIYNNNEGYRIAGVYYLDDPVAGTADLVVTFDASTECRIGAVSLGNAADGVSVTADVVAADTDSLSVNLTTIAKDTLVVGVYSNNNGSSDDTEPYPTDQRISHGASGSSNTYSGYVQVPEPSGPTAYTWTISAGQVSDAVLAGFASAGEIVTNPIVVTNSAEAYSADAAGNVHTLSGFAVSGSAGRKLVVCTGTENAGTVTGITYGGTPLTLAVANDFARFAEVWYLDDPAVGSADIVVTMSAVGEDKDMRIAALSLAGAQSGVSVSTNLGLANVTTLTVPLETTAKDTLVVGTFTNNGIGISDTPFANTVTNGTSGSSSMNAGYMNVADPVSADYVWTNAGDNNSGAALAGFAALVDYQEPEPETYATIDTPVVAVTPTIDGVKSLGEWGDAFELPMQWPALGMLPNIGSVSLGGLPETEADVDDISAVFYFKWDATSLYILAEVTDDVLIKPTAGGDGHPDDHFILGIDPDLTDGDADVNIFLAEFFIDSNDAASHYFRTDLVPGIVDPALNVFTSHSVTGSIVTGGYVIELALDWADLGVTSPVATDMIGVSILLFDNDVDDAARDVVLNSTGGSIVVPSEYHQVTLTGLQNTFANYISQYDVGELTAGTDDPDSDEVDNFTEYALGGDPTVSDAPSIQPVGELATQEEDDVFAYTYNRRIGAAALGLSYAVKGKTDLTAPTWTTTGITDEVEVTTLNDEFEAVTATTPMDGFDNKFLHLEITD